MSGRHGEEKSLELGRRDARSEDSPSVSGRQSVRSNRSLRSSNSASSRSRTSTYRQIAPKPPVKSVGSSGSSRAPRDLSLTAYIRSIRVVATSCDEALERQKANFQKVPPELTALQDKIGGVLKLVEGMKGGQAARGGASKSSSRFSYFLWALRETRPLPKGLPGSQEIMKGRVSDEMFRELKGTERNIAEYSKQPVSIIAGMLSGWLWTAEEDRSPARLRLEQLVQTCESLDLIEEILTKQLQVLNWDVVDAIKPPVEQIILSPEQVKLGVSRTIGTEGASTTCCFCCDSAPIPVQEPPSKRASAGQRSTGKSSSSASQ